MKAAVRIVIVVLLLAAGFVILQGNQTTAAAQDAYDMLDASLDAGPTTPTAEEVHEKMGRQPDSVENVDKHHVIENYEFNSMVRSHTLKVHYNKAATMLMTKIEMD